MFWCKLYRTKQDTVVAICDENILGKKITHTKMNMSVEVKKDFYGGVIINDDQAVKLMNDATIGNLIGTEIVKLAEKNGFITKENIILIDGIPHAQFVKS